MKLIIFCLMSITLNLYAQIIECHSTAKTNGLSNYKMTAKIVDSNILSFSASIKLEQLFGQTYTNHYPKGVILDRSGAEFLYNIPADKKIASGGRFTIANQTSISRLNSGINAHNIRMSFINTSDFNQLSPTAYIYVHNGSENGFAVRFQKCQFKK